MLNRNERALLDGLAAQWRREAQSCYWQDPGRMKALNALAKVVDKLPRVLRATEGRGILARSYDMIVRNRDRARQCLLRVAEARSIPIADISDSAADEFWSRLIDRIEADIRARGEGRRHVG